MRTKRDYASALKNALWWINSRFKPLTIHTEAIMIDSVWEKIKEAVKEKGVLKWYVMTPCNLEYFKASFNINMSKKELSETMKQRYKWMLKKGQKLELHIHLSMLINKMNYKEQETFFKEALEWMKRELEIVPKEFVPGWWIYNKDTLKICKKFGLKMIYSKDYDVIHDYEWDN